MQDLSQVEVSRQVKALTLQGASILFRELGVKRIPLGGHSKEPAFEYLPLNSEGKPTWKIPIADEDLDKIFEEHPELNIGAILGGPSNNLFEIDFDSPATFEKFTGGYEGAAFKDHTLTYSTGRGFKILAFSDKPLDFTKIDCRPALEMELRSNDCYTVLPPSIHPNGKRYTVLGTWQITVMPDAKERVLQRAREIGWKGSVDGKAPASLKVPILRADKSLTLDECSQIVTAILPLWVKDYRNEVCMSLIGYLLKKGVREEDTQKIIDDTTTLAEDEERSKRLADVRYHYSQRIKLNLKGWSGVRDVARKLKREGVSLG